MAKVTFSTDIQSISGKLCSKEGVVYSVNRRTGKTYRSDRHVYNDANTEAQQSVRGRSRRRLSSPPHGGNRTARPAVNPMDRKLTVW